MKFLAKLRHADGDPASVCAEIEIDKKQIQDLFDKFSTWQDGSLVSITLRTSGVQLYAMQRINFEWRSALDEYKLGEENKIVSFHSAFVTVGFEAKGHELTLRWTINTVNYCFVTGSFFIERLLEKS